MGTIVLTRDGTPVGTFELGPSPVLVGSDSSCGICVPGEGVGARHLALVEKNGVAALKELIPGSGVCINNQPVANSAMIRDGDQITFASYILQYQKARKAAPVAAATTIEPGSPPTMTRAASSDCSLDDEEDEEEELVGDDPGADPEGGGDGNVQVGEFYEPDQSEDIDVAASRAEGLQPLAISEPLMNVIRARLGLYSELDRLDKERAEMLSSDSLSDSAKAELNRQTRECQKLPSAEQALGSTERTNTKIRKIEEKAEAEEGEPMDPRMRQALGMAVHQWDMISQHEERVPEILDAAAPYLEKEPLYWILKEGGIDADEMFGFAVYVLGLEALSGEQAAKRKALRAQRSGQSKESKGVLGLLRRSSSTPTDDDAEFRRKEEQAASIMSWISRETSDLQKRMVECFWKTYELAAQLLVRGGLERQKEMQLRAFLRYGLIGIHPYFMNPDHTRRILRDCSTWREEWNYSMSETHVLYADEYIVFIARGACTPSVDEDLELNQRNSPAWKADKAWRRAIFSRVRQAALSELRQTLDSRVTVLRSQQAKTEELRDKLMRGSKDYKKKHREASQKIQHNRVEAARFERAVQRIDEVYMPNVLQQRQTAKEKLAAAGIRLTASDLLRREILGIRRVTRLLANLKEPFLPFALRDNYKPDTDALNERDSILEEVKSIEQRDPTIFLEPLMPVKKKAHRLHMRFSPVILLTPGCGFLGYAWNPRNGSEIGRLAVPLYAPRPRLRERLLLNMFADFRWDTSKASAGVDLLTSDTLVAAYATVRWEYRKRSKEAREKAAIFNEDNDRKNWRRHYELYLLSANEGGKKLFFKCLEAYEQVVLKYLELPEGVERLRR